MLEKAIRDRQIQQDRRDNLKKIDPQLLRQTFQKLDFQILFKTLKYDFKNNYNCELRWHRKQTIEINGTKNQITNRLIVKIKGFFQWFVGCQTIVLEDLKVNVRQPNAKKIGGDVVAKGLYNRINEIVDSTMEHHTLKKIARGLNNDRHPRTSRMVAVCWVLVNLFDCTIKGGFVRDWVVNGKDFIPIGLDLSNLLQKNPRNPFLEVVDEQITPSDIDVQMSKDVVFDEQRFIKEMQKLGIEVKIQQQSWRKHILFDQHSLTGGFTADLIQPYSFICHDTYDFDVNVFYLKKDHLSQIGMKIPLNLSKITPTGRKTFQVQLEQLIVDCREKKMRVIKPGIFEYRYIKFEARGWKIDRQSIYQPAVYKNYFDTMRFEDTIERFSKLCPDFTKKLPGKKIIRVESLVNQSWNSGYISAINWILRQTKNLNEKILYHGTGPDGIAGILKLGFDSRYWGVIGQRFGRGAYFADDPSKSDRYTATNAKKEKGMFVVLVALGTQEQLTVDNNQKRGPSRGYHSIYTNVPGEPHQYVLERWGQAKPIYLITYKD